MKQRQSQQGVTLISLAVMLAILAFFVLLVLRLMPSYLEYFNVKSSMESLANEQGAGQMPTSEIRKLLSRRFDINDVEHVQRDDIKVKRESGKTVVSLEYEVRVHVMGNVDAVTHFQHEVELGRN